MYITASGRIITMNSGVTKLITKIVFSTVKEAIRNDRIERGIVSSMVLMSLENRLRIRPDGVVSKNDIGSRRMFTSNRLWISFDAKMAPVARENVAITTKLTWPTPNRA